MKRAKKEHNVLAIFELYDSFVSCMSWPWNLFSSCSEEHLWNLEQIKPLGFVGFLKGLGGFLVLNFQSCVLHRIPLCLLFICPETPTTPTIRYFRQSLAHCSWHCWLVDMVDWVLSQIRLHPVYLGATLGLAYHHVTSRLWSAGHLRSLSWAGREPRQETGPEMRVDHEGRNRSWRLCHSNHPGTLEIKNSGHWLDMV